MIIRQDSDVTRHAADIEQLITNDRFDPKTGDLEKDWINIFKEKVKIFLNTAIFITTVSVNDIQLFYLNLTSIQNHNEHLEKYAYVSTWLREPI